MDRDDAARVRAQALILIDFARSGIPSSLRSQRGSLPKTTLSALAEAVAPVQVEVVEHAGSCVKCKAFMSRDRYHLQLQRRHLSNAQIAR
jgi:hypothetical protein